ncbi:PREDICTED: uncharacterized protein LOC109185193 [Ipomoea nil]|uniref:uncharacterized protein LOC109185193 n=1 Tax=Ipomoea nil TaxID=35883 RepID=UPI0009015950|nr:PREDICTED: uncharacterized protein LOC109185193 [Ipomoea nil]
MEAHDMVVAGVRRRIGNGEATLIWGYPWLPDDPSPFIQTNMPEQLREARVAGLINPQTDACDPHILTDLFDEDDVTCINRIQISPRYEDSWYWLGDPRGVYTVKNAYRNIMRNYVHAAGDFGKWTTVWKMRVPPKWRTFLWRAICDILPTTNNLIIKRMEVEPTCQMCGLANEDIMHALVTCEYSRLIWNVLGLPITNIITGLFPAWLTGALAMLTEEQSALMVAILYQLWRCRNSAVWDGALPPPVGA